MHKKVFRLRDEIAFRKSDDGTMTIVSPVTDKIITINSTATEIWEMIDGQASVGAIADKFVVAHREENDFPGEKVVIEDVFEIIVELLNKELLEVVEV